MCWAWLFTARDHYPFPSVVGNAYMHVLHAPYLHTSIHLSFPLSPDFWAGVLFNSRSLSTGSSLRTSVKILDGRFVQHHWGRPRASQWSSITTHTRVSTLLKTWTCVKIIFSPPNENVNSLACAHYRSSYYSTLRKHLVSKVDTTYPPTLS